MPPAMDSFKILISCFLLSAMGGFFALLRSNRVITWRNAAAATLYPGLMGLVVALCCYKYAEAANNLYLLVGTAGMIGLGGVTLIDLILSLASQGGVQVHISPAPSPQAPRDDQEEMRPSVLKSSQVNAAQGGSDPEPGRSSSIGRPWVEL